MFMSACMYLCTNKSLCICVWMCIYVYIWNCILYIASATVVWSSVFSFPLIHLIYLHLWFSIYCIYFLVKFSLLYTFNLKPLLLLLYWLFRECSDPTLLCSFSPHSKSSICSTKSIYPPISQFSLISKLPDKNLKLQGVIY